MRPRILMGSSPKDTPSIVVINCETSYRMKVFAIL